VTGSNVPQGGDSFSTSLGLLERAKRRENGAWDRLVRLYTPLVDYWCRQGRVRGADIEDIRQDVFRKLLRKLGDFHHDQPGDSFRGWLRTITRNAVRDQRRRAHRWLEGEGGSDALARLSQVPANESSDDTGAPQPCKSEEMGILLRQALRQSEPEFTRRTWQAFMRMTFDAEPASSVAADLGITVNAAYLAKSRVLRRIRDELAGVLDFEQSVRFPEHVVTIERDSPPEKPRS